jgi:hypothetical protein
VRRRPQVSRLRGGVLGLWVWGFTGGPKALEWLAACAHSRRSTHKQHTASALASHPAAACLGPLPAPARYWYHNRSQETSWAEPADVAEFKRRADAETAEVRAAGCRVGGRGPEPPKCWLGPPNAFSAGCLRGGRQRLRQLCCANPRRPLLPCQPPPSAANAPHAAAAGRAARRGQAPARRHMGRARRGARPARRGCRAAVGRPAAGRERRGAAAGAH